MLTRQDAAVYFGRPSWRSGPPLGGSENGVKQEKTSSCFHLRSIHHHRREEDEAHHSRVPRVPSSLPPPTSVSADTAASLRRHDENLTRETAPGFLASPSRLILEKK